MKKYLVLFAFSLSLYGQTDFPGPVRSLAPNDDSESSANFVQDRAQHFIGFLAPALVTQIVVTACTAANPTVCTLANPRPTTIKAGGTATLSGAMGAGTSGLNATHTVTAVGASTITLAFNCTGCTYTASSATLETHIQWELPAADCVANQALGYSAPYVLGCVAANGANRQLSNLLTTSINADLLFDTNDTYRVGNTNRLYAVHANRFEGFCSGCSSAVNYMITRDLVLYDKNIADVGWDIMTTLTVGVNSWIEIRDNAGASVLKLERMFGSGTTNIGTISMDWVPSGARDLGSTGSPWDFAYIQNLFIPTYAGFGIRCLQIANTGEVYPAASACGTASAPFVDTTSIIEGSSDATKELRFEVDGITTGTVRVATPPNADFTMAGINITQTFTADQTLSADLIAGSNTRKLGTTTQFYQVAADRFEGICSGCTASTNYVNTRKFNMYDSGGNGVVWDMYATLNPTVSENLVIRDRAGTNLLKLEQYFASSLVNRAVFSLGVMPNTDATYAMGTASTRWAKSYYTDLRISSLASSGPGAFNCVFAGDLGDLGIGSGTCVTATRTIFTTSPLTGGGNLSGNLTLAIQVATSGQNGYLSSTDWSTFNAKMTNPMTSAGDVIYGLTSGVPNRLAAGTSGQFLGIDSCIGNCFPQWRTLSGTSPIAVSGYAVSCSTCVTTAGGQSIAGTTTLSTLSISSALAGTYNLSGNETVTGNFYMRTFSGGDASCGGVANGWLGYRTDTNEIQSCSGGTLKKVSLI